MGALADGALPLARSHADRWKLASHPRDHPGWRHSQYNQDCIVMALMQFQRDGFFVDLAANKAIDTSNTRALERDFGWRGVCIEPNPMYHRELLAHRNCTVIPAAVSNHEGTVRFRFNGAFGGLARNTSAGDQAGTGEVQSVSFRSLARRLAMPTTIDLLSLDVEGAETMVLESFPYNSHTIRVATIEVHTTPLAAVEARLAPHGYSCLCVTRIPVVGDAIFVHASTMRESSPIVAQVLRATKTGTACPSCHQVIPANITSPDGLHRQLTWEPPCWTRAKRMGTFA